MSAYLAYLAKRLGQFVLVVFIGVNLAYVVTHATPIDPVEQSIGAATSFGNTAPEAIEQMRQHLDDSINRGQGFLRYQNWDDAVGELERARALSPNSTDVLLPLAAAYAGRWHATGSKEDRALALQRAERALQQLERLLALTEDQLPPVGLPVVMGPGWRTRVTNLRDGPVDMVCPPGP